MQSNCKYYLIATTVLGAVTFGSAAIHAQTTTVDTHIGPLKYESGFPTKETVERLYDEIDFQRACQAYMWSFPAVSFASVKAGMFRDLGATYNDIVLYQDFLDTKSIYLTGNSTTVYASSPIDLAKDGPVVVEVPAGPTAGMVADLWFITRGVGRIGPDKGKGGKYLLVPPGYKGNLPAKGYYIVRFETMDANYFIRGIVIKGDVKGAADMIAKSRVYPYSERANPKPNQSFASRASTSTQSNPRGSRIGSGCRKSSTTTRCKSRIAFSWRCSRGWASRRANRLRRMLARSASWKRVRVSVVPWRRTSASI